MIMIKGQGSTIVTIRGQGGTMDTIRGQGSTIVTILKQSTLVNTTPDLISIMSALSGDMAGHSRDRPPVRDDARGCALYDIRGGINHHTSIVVILLDHSANLFKSF